MRLVHSSRSRWLVFLVLAAITLPACSDAPTDPGGDDGSGTGGFVDAPPIPEPSSPGGDVPSRSETYSRIEPYRGNFRARLVDVVGSWTKVRECGPEPITIAGPDRMWASEARLTLGRYGTLATLVTSEARDLIDPELGQLRIEEELSRFVSCADPFPSGGFETTAFRSDRFDADSVSATLSETFSSSVTVSESTTETFTKTVTGRDGRIIQFMVWELVEDYSFTDANGDPIASDSFELDLGTLQRRGAAIAMKSKEFPLAP